MNVVYQAGLTKVASFYCIVIGSQMTELCFQVSSVLRDMRLSIRMHDDGEVEEHMAKSQGGCLTSQPTDSKYSDNADGENGMPRPKALAAQVQALSTQLAAVMAVLSEYDYDSVWELAQEAASSSKPWMECMLSEVLQDQEESVAGANAGVGLVEELYGV